MKSKKHKLSAIVFCTVFLALALVLPNMAFAEQWGDFTYTVSGGQVTITKYTGSIGAVVIPSDIDGMPVVGIGNSAFAYRSSLTIVTIPDSVTSIGDSAFYSCSSLTSIVVDASNTAYSSQDGVLYDKAKKVLLEYPCGKSGGFIIPDSVTSIGNSAFAYCSSLTIVTIPDSVTSIGDGAFYYCTGLTSVTIGNSVTRIGYGAFEECSSLTSVTIGNSVTSIGDYAFRFCGGLTSILVDANNTIFSSQDGVLYDKAKTTLIECPEGKSGSFTIPDSVTTIGVQAFDSCTGLTSVTIGNSVTRIGSAAFTACTGLTSVIIPDSVTSIGDYAFYKCSGLTSVTIPDSVKYIELRAFYYCTGLTSVTIGNSVTRIGYGAFKSCKSLTRAYFLGNAPSMSMWGINSKPPASYFRDGVFDKCAINFTICYTAGSRGFTFPLWYGYPARVCPCAAESIYGENAEEAELLREYRDNVLSKTPEGQEIIKTYYQYSPTVTELLERRPLLKDKARMIIDSMLPGIRKKVEESNKEQ